MTDSTRWALWLLPVVTLAGTAAYADAAGEVGTRAGVVVIPVIPVEAAPTPQEAEPGTPDDMEPPRAPRKIPEVRDPTRGMIDPHTEREGDARSLDQLSRDRLNIDGKRSRSLDDLASPLRERRRIDQSRGRLREPGDSAYGASSLKNRLGVQDSRRDYRIESTHDIGQEYIEENGSSDYRVYRRR